MLVAKLTVSIKTWQGRRAGSPSKAPDAFLRRHAYRQGISWKEHASKIDERFMLGKSRELTSCSASGYGCARLPHQYQREGINTYNPSQSLALSTVNRQASQAFPEEFRVGMLTCCTVLACKSGEASTQKKQRVGRILLIRSDRLLPYCPPHALIHKKSFRLTGTAWQRCLLCAFFAGLRPTFCGIFSKVQKELIWRDQATNPRLAMHSFKSCLVDDEQCA